MRRNLAVAIVLLAVIMAGCGGGGDGPAESGSEPDTATATATAGSQNTDSPVATNDQEDAEPTPAPTAAVESDSQADEVVVGDRWAWCADWAAIGRYNGSVSAAERALDRAEIARSAADSDFEKARAKADYDDARDAIDAAETAQENALSVLENALNEAQSAAIAADDEIAYIAADIGKAAIDYHNLIGDPTRNRLRKSVSEAPSTVLSLPIATMTELYLLIWIQPDSSKEIEALRQATDAGFEAGYHEIPLWAAAAVAMEAAAEAWAFVRFAELRENNDDDDLYFQQLAAKAAKAEEWAAAAWDAVWVYYNTTNVKTREDAAAWAGQINSEAPGYHWLNVGGAYEADHPSPPSHPQTVSDHLEATAESKQNPRYIRDERKNVWTRSHGQSSSDRESAINQIDTSARITGIASSITFAPLHDSLTDAIMLDLCDR